MIEVAITDDHVIVIEGIRTLLKSSKEVVISQAFTSIAETVGGLHPRVQVLLLDINLPDGSGIEACKDILQRFPNLRIIALTNYEDVSFVKQAIRNGAMGYLLKNTDKTQLIDAIKAVLAGERYLPKNVREMLLNESLGKAPASAAFIPKLTNREKEILGLIIKEYTTEEIAAKIFISTKTVESHRSNLIQKVGVKNTAGLVRVALERGLI